MCGIITAISKKDNVNDRVLAQFQNQISRGTQGFGIVFVNEDKTFKVKRSTDQVKALVDMNLNESKFIMFHHRWPTSSANLTEQTHPLFISDKTFKHDYLIIHNGVIQNDEELMKDHEELGFSYRTKYEEYSRTKFNDSESLALEIARYLEKQTTEINIEGSAAFVCLQIDKEKQKIIKLMYGTNGDSPLKLDTSNDEIFLSSTGPGETVPKNTLFTINMKNLKTTQSKLVFHEEVKPVAPVFENDYHTSSHYYGKQYPLAKNEEPKSKTVKYYGREYDEAYFDIVKESKIEIEDALDTFYEYIQNISYTNSDEVEDTLKLIRQALYHAEAQAIQREEELTLAEDDLTPAEKEDMEAWNKSFLKE